MSPPVAELGIEKPVNDPQLTGECAADPTDIARRELLLEARDYLAEQGISRISNYLNGLNDDIDRSAIASRLARTRLVLAEAGSAYKGREVIIHGGYAAADRSAGVAIAADEHSPKYMHRLTADYQADQDILKTVVHEFYHAASHPLSETSVGPDGKQRSEVDIPTGLEKDRGLGKNFWLNEAVTEELALATLGIDDPEKGSYASPRRLFKEVLRISHIPLALFIEAYFEEPDMRLPPGHRYPKWERLTDEIAKHFGPRFLRKITRMDGWGRLSGEMVDGKWVYGRQAVEKAHHKWQRHSSRLGKRALFRTFRRS